MKKILIAKNRRNVFVNEPQEFVSSSSVHTTPSWANSRSSEARSTSFALEDLSLSMVNLARMTTTEIKIVDLAFIKSEK